MNEFLARLTSESPAFFKKLQKVALWLVGIAGAVLVANIPEGVTLPTWLIEACKWLVFGGTILFGGAKLPVKDHGELQDKLNK